MPALLPSFAYVKDDISICMADIFLKIGLGMQFSWVISPAPHESPRNKV